MTCPDPALLGVRTDSELAREWRVTVHRVRVWRMQQGRAPAVVRRTSIVLDQPELLGTTSDGILAAAWGVSRSTVSTWRRTRGIPQASSPYAPLPSNVHRLCTDSKKARVIEALTAGASPREAAEQVNSTVHFVRVVAKMLNG